MYFRQIYLFFIAILLFSCKQEDLGWKEIPYTVKIERFDLALDSLNQNNITKKHDLWKNNYGFFYTDYIENILGIAPISEDAYIIENLHEIEANENFQKLTQDVKEKFSDLTSHEKEIEEAMKRLKYSLPEIQLPQRFISFTSGFIVQNTLGEDYLGIGLDMFLGSEAPYYLEIMGAYPLYISNRFTPENITPRVTESYIKMELFAEIDLEKTFLEQAIEHGKALYLMDIALPHTPDSIKIGYKKAHMDWALKNERSIWDWFLKEIDIYSRDYLKFQKHFSEAPFTPELANRDESAPKLGIFIGWQIVKNYMKNNKEATLKEMLEEENAQAFLEKSRY